MKFSRPLWRRLWYLFLASWLLLVLWAMPTFRVGARFAVLNALGFGSGLVGLSIPETIGLQQFQPVSLLVPEDAHELSRPKFPLVEFHGHIFPTYRGNLDEDLRRNRTNLFVNLALRTTTGKAYNELQAKHPGSLHFPGWNWDRLKEASGIAKIAADLEDCAKAGAKGVKLWKDFGLMRKKADGSLYRLDDPAFDPLWDVAAKHHLVIAMHTADPPAFFLPIDGKNERFEEITRHPEWAFTGGPTFDDIMAQRERLFQRRRDVRFVALHFGEFGHDLKRAARLLDANPNVWIDTAQRIDELGRQPRQSRAFFLKYSDRILYGTDGPPDYEKDRIYWRFFETDDEYFDYHPPAKDRKGLWKISGIALPDDVLQKIYYRNALGLLGMSEQEFLAKERQ